MFRSCYLRMSFISLLALCVLSSTGTSTKSQDDPLRICPTQTCIYFHFFSILSREELSFFIFIFFMFESPKLKPMFLSFLNVGLCLLIFELMVIFLESKAIERFCLLTIKSLFLVIQFLLFNQSFYLIFFFVQPSTQLVSLKNYWVYLIYLNYFLSLRNYIHKALFLFSNKFKSPYFDTIECLSLNLLRNNLLLFYCQIGNFLFAICIPLYVLYFQINILLTFYLSNSVQLFITNFSIFIHFILFIFNSLNSIIKISLLIMDKGSSPLKLHTKLKFWYQHFVKGEGNFEDSLLPVAVVQTVEDLWKYYQHFKRPSQLEEGSYIYLFQQHVKPVWEDQHNKKGGAFVLRFERTKCDRLWQDLLLSYAVSPKEQVGDITGMRIKIRKDQTAEIDFWASNSSAGNLEKYREWILKRTDLESGLALEFIQFFKQE